MRPKSRPCAHDLTARIREVRVAAFGERGRARFARALGLSPSTYNYYERGRVPPMPVLLRISEVAGVDLRWLLTGQAPTGHSGVLLPEHAQILARMGAILPQRAEAADALNALLDLLEAHAQVEREAVDGPDRGATPAPDTPGAPGAARIPVLGRTAAGVPHFWSRSQESVDVLAAAVARSVGSGSARAGRLAGPEETTPVDADPQVCLVQLAKPVRVGDLCISEFVDCRGPAERWTDAFALRIDGESMHPSLSHGDLVVLSPQEPAKPGRPAVVQLRDQIGVTCKLFYRDERQIRLIPINEQFQPTTHSLKDLVWALAVLHRIRLLT